MRARVSGVSSGQIRSDDALGFGRERQLFDRRKRLDKRRGFETLALREFAWKCSGPRSGEAMTKKRKNLIKENRISRELCFCAGKSQRRSCRLYEHPEKGQHRLSHQKFVHRLGRHLGNRNQSRYSVSD